MSDKPAPNVKRPMTKAARLSVIEDVLLNHIVTSQQQLLGMLAQQGLDVTQSTLSRDLDELHAVKTRKADGSVAYEMPLPAHANTTGAQTVEPMPAASMRDEQQLSKTLTGLVISVAAAGNIVVLHTPSGAAQYLGSVLDRASLDSVLGTIAGDDTVMIVTSDAPSAQRTAQRLLALAADQRTAGATDEAENAD
ncbi:MAG: arginine repressor [Bifidobacteriaceae bacterium]|nr:arginine repressor [Bifidobacteriaceae bacterium]